jgi:hypothetical protein
MSATEETIEEALRKHLNFKSDMKATEDLLVTSVIDWCEKQGNFMDLHEMIMEAFNPDTPWTHKELGISFSAAKFIIENEIAIAHDLEYDDSDEEKEEKDEDGVPQKAITAALIAKAPTEQHETISNKVSDACLHYLTQSPMVLTLSDCVLNAFFPLSNVHRPIDCWTYYKQIDHFIADNRERFFPWISEAMCVSLNTIDSVFHFETKTRTCSFRIMKIMERAKDFQLSFCEINNQIDNLFYADPIVNAYANHVDCHEAVFVYLKMHFTDYQYLEHILDQPFKNVYDNYRQKGDPGYHMKSNDGAEAVNNLIEAFCVSDTSNELLSLQIDELAEKPGFEEIRSENVIKDIVKYVHDYREEHGSDHPALTTEHIRLPSPLCSLEHGEEKRQTIRYKRRYRVDYTKPKRQRCD